MVVLMESPGLTLKRKGAEEPGLFMCPGDGEGVPLSCRATKIRRLESADHQGDVPTPPAVASVGTGGDVMMGEAPSLAVADEERAVTVYDPAARGPLSLPTRWRLRPWAPLRAGAEWIRDMLREADLRTVREMLTGAHEEGAGTEWIRDMLREADFRTVREMLTGAHEEGAGMAVVPWGVAPAPPSTEASTAAETVDGEDAEETAKMDVEEERGHQTQPFGAGCGEGYLYRCPQHCMAPPQLPAVGQASPVMWSW